MNADGTIQIYGPQRVDINPDGVKVPRIKAATPGEDEEELLNEFGEPVEEFDIMGDPSAFAEGDGGAGSSTTGTEQAEVSSAIGPTVTAMGTADQNDVALVNAELAKVPEKYRKIMQDKGVNVAVVRNSVVEYNPNLQGVQPRGWPPGSSWDDVPGLYDPNTNTVVIATVGHGTTVGPHVPQTGEGHGSQNIVLHESGHSFENEIKNSPQFIGARNADMQQLSDYEKQSGDAGLSETCAESFANAFGGNPDYSSTHPNLDAFWQHHEASP
jgi:hypothetical protein